MRFTEKTEEESTPLRARSSWRTQIRDGVRDRLARQTRRMGAMADLEKVAPQWSKRYKHKNGVDSVRVVRIGVVVTVFGRDEVQQLDVAIRRPTALANVEGSAGSGGLAAHPGRQGKNENAWAERGSRTGHGAADQL